MDINWWQQIIIGILILNVGVLIVSILKYIAHDRQNDDDWPSGNYGV